MEKIITVEAMRQSDAYTIKNFIDSKDLMFKAGKSVFECGKWNGSTAIVCGSGNNAGDGYVLARILNEAGFDCKLFLLKNKFSEDGEYYFNQCVERGIKYTICDDNTSFKEYTTVVDCVFGTGFKGEVKGIASDIIDKINNSGAYVISVDINSGLNGDTGLAYKAVKSNLTVSIGYYKTGHFLNDANKYIERLVNANIDIELITKPYFLAEKNQIDVNNAKIYSKNCLENSLNPVEAIENLAKRNNQNVLVNNLGDYSVYSDGNSTYIFRG